MYLKEVDQQKILIFYILKNEFFNPYVLPVKIKTEYQNAEEVKTDFLSDAELAAELNPDYNLPCFNLLTKLTFKMLKNKFLNVERNSLFTVILKSRLKVWINRLCIFLFKNLLKQNHVFKICFINSRCYLASLKLLVSWAPKLFLNCGTQTNRQSKQNYVSRNDLSDEKIKNLIRPLLILLYDYWLTNISLFT